MKKKENAEVATDNEQQQQQPRALEHQQPRSELIETPKETKKKQIDEQIGRVETTESAT